MSDLASTVAKKFPRKPDGIGEELGRYLFGEGSFQNYAARQDKLKAQMAAAREAAAGHLAADNPLLTMPIPGANPEVPNVLAGIAGILSAGAATAAARNTGKQTGVAPSVEVKPTTQKLDDYWTATIEPSGSFRIKGLKGEHIGGQIAGGKAQVEVAGLPPGTQNPNPAIQKFASTNGVEAWFSGGGRQTTQGAAAVDRMIQSGRIKPVPGELGFRYDFSRPSYAR